MYFLEQIRTQFTAFVVNYQWNPTDGPSGEIDPIDQHIARNDVDTPENLAFQELNEELDAIDNDSKLVSTYTTILGTFLENVKAGKYPWLSEQDDDFKRLLELYSGRFEELKTLSDRGHQIEHVISQSINSLGETVDMALEGEDISAQLDAAYDNTEQQESLEKFVIERDSYSGVLREKRSTIPEGTIVSPWTEDIFTEIESIIGQNLEGTYEENLLLLTDWNENILNLFAELDSAIQQDVILAGYVNLDKAYTTEDLPVLRTGIEWEITKFRTTFFEDIIWEEDTGKALSEYKDHPNVLKLSREEVEWLSFWYDMEDMLETFENINIEEIWTDQEKGTTLQVALYLHTDFNRKLDIAARDSQIIEWETTLWAKRLETTHEGYETLLENDDIKGALESSDWNVPSFEDLWMTHFNLIREQGGDLRQLFMTTETWEALSESWVEVWKSYIINFWANSELANALNFSFLDINGGEISIDGISAEFNPEWVRWPWYYTADGRKISMMDGSKVDITTAREIWTPVQETELRGQINEQVGALWLSDTERRVFNEAVYSHPDGMFTGETLPKWLMGMIAAILLNLFDGKNFVRNPETGIWEDLPEWATSGSPRTNGEVVWTYRWSMELWSLSAEFESASQWAYAYNPDDNGHGPSFGTYQMNSEVWVYPTFASKYGIAPWQGGWNAAIEKHWVAEFQRMEHEHIKENNYDPMIRRITVANKEDFSIAMQNVIWSIWVQHGPGHSWILAVINNSGVTPWDRQSEAQLINALYDKRGDVYPPGVASRYNRERANALSMLNNLSTPITAEQLAEFGGTWGQLAAWIHSIGYRKFVDRPSNCGANVWEALDTFWFTGLPQSWRHWYLWASFMEERPSQFRELTWVTPENAPAGSIISYEQNSWGSDARKAYGHVEIAMWNDTWYYFWQKNTEPGGSNPNPQSWDYRIFVPISKT